MKCYKVAYAPVQNAGDLLNICILKNLFDVKVECSGYLSANMIGIGSCLGECQYSSVMARRLRQLVFPCKTQYVWGTGFMYEEQENERKFSNKRLKFKAVRGNLTKKRVEKLLGHDIGEIPLCDGGILTSNMFPIPPVKKYRLGIIPHYKEQDEPVFQKLLSFNDDSVIIDLKKEPMSVYKQIGQCELIISSSLHGLIIADSFGIPNLHVRVTDKLMGDGFKFRDYYSGYGLADNCFDLTQYYPTLSTITNEYAITKKSVEKKKLEMYEAFPRL